MLLNLNQLSGWGWGWFLRGPHSLRCLDFENYIYIYNQGINLGTATYILRHYNHIVIQLGWGGFCVVPSPCGAVSQRVQGH